MVLAIAVPAMRAAMVMPTMALAQQGPYNDKQNPNEYTDTEDGQLLKVVSYFIAPIGYALEWGVTRPLHYLATKTSLAPMMSGDTEYSQNTTPARTFGQSYPCSQPTRPQPPSEPRRKPTSSARRSARSRCRHRWCR